LIKNDLSKKHRSESDYKLQIESHLFLKTKNHHKAGTVIFRVALWSKHGSKPKFQWFMKNYIFYDETTFVQHGETPGGILGIGGGVWEGLGSIAGAGDIGGGGGIGAWWGWKTPF
jgi:hypothetical protein